MTGQERHDAVMDALRDLRNLHDVELCGACGGWGVATYANTSTWRKGVGGNMLTSDVCDTCWGSGNAERPWPSHRLMLATHPREPER